MIKRLFLISALALLGSPMFAQIEVKEGSLNNVVAPVSVTEQYNYLIVKAEQQNALIYIDDVYVGDGQVSKSFKVGETHNWRIECKMYHPESGQVTITFPDKVEVERNLRPAFGYLNVTSQPESGATVLIDGDRVGVTPYKSERLASGEHKVQVIKEMYSPSEQTFMVTDGNTTEAEMTMSANFALITVTTDSQSDIYIDNENMGRGSWSGKLSAGDHVFEAIKASHKTTMKTATLSLGQTATIILDDPIPIYGTIDVNTDPMECAIIIDGVRRGETPAIINDVLIGDHELKLEKAGCATVVKTITIDDKKDLTINEKLLRGRKISILTGSKGDKIFVDDNYVGTSPFTSSLSFGNHEVKAIRDTIEIKKTITVSQYGKASVRMLFSDILTFTVKDVTFEMVAVHGGTFTMGCTPEQDGDCEEDETPTHSVTVGDFYIGKFEVTQELWYAVMGTNIRQQRDKVISTHPILGEGNRFPMYYINWQECQEFIEKLNKLTGQNFRLPTEAEWEYAARGGNKSYGYKYSGSNTLGDVAWYSDNSRRTTHPVGLKAPNELGIYDMSGNVFEWCQDWYGDYSSNSQTNPIGPSGPKTNFDYNRVVRGGCHFNGAGNCRVSDRHFVTGARNGILGLRLVLP